MAEKKLTNCKFADRNEILRVKKMKTTNNTYMNKEKLIKEPVNKATEDNRRKMRA